MAGGTDRDGELPTEILAYDPSADAWRRAGSLDRGRISPGVAVAGERVYVLGGFEQDPYRAIDDVSILDPSAGVVEAGVPLPAPRGDMAVVVLDGRIHAIGGYSEDPEFGSIPSSEHDVYDPATGEWSSLSPLPPLLMVQGAAVVDGRIFVATGVLEPRIHQYDPLTDTWCAPWNGVARWLDRAIAAVEDRIYFLGGSYWSATECCDGPHPDPAVDRFDPRSGAWEAQPSMITARDGHAVAVVERDIYVIGGSLNGQHTGALAVNERFRPH